MSELNPDDPMLRINQNQYEFNKFKDNRESVKCIVKRSSSATGDPKVVQLQLEKPMDVSLQYKWTNKEKTLDRGVPDAHKIEVVKLSKFPIFKFDLLEVIDLEKIDDMSNLVYD